MSANMAKYTEVVSDGFDNGLSEIWTSLPRRDVHMTNSPLALFLDGTETDATGDPLGIAPISVQDGVLELGSGVIPEEDLPSVRQLLQNVGQGSRADPVKYYTSMIATDRSWAQTYGYYEVVARIPEGKGHWSAFWLTSSGEQWPPEIDIAEAYGRGVDTPTPKDRTFNSAVHFDEYDEAGNRVFDIDIDNPYDLDENGNPTPADVRVAGGKEYGHFVEVTDAATHGLDIYDAFVTFAVEWTPAYISFLVGPDRDSLVEIYRTPTPDDVKSPLYFLANDQIGSNWGWDPVPGYDDQTFAPGNALEIDSISIYAMKPEAGAYAPGITALILGEDDPQRIFGTSGEDIVVAGGNYEEIDLRAGRDLVFIEAAGTSNKIISNFGSDDVLVLEGWSVDGTSDALDRLVQVGSDVWLRNGAYPAHPQTIVFRDAGVDDFAAGNFVVRWSETPNIWSSARVSSVRVNNSEGTGYVHANEVGTKLSDGGSNAPGTVTVFGSGQGDEYYIYRPWSLIVEQPGGGVDTVYAYRSVTLDAHVENLVGAVDTSGTTLVGNDLGNRITVGGAGQIVDGKAGDDLLDLGGFPDGTVIHGSGDGHDTVVGFGPDSVLFLSGLTFPDWAALRLRLVQLGKDVILDLGSEQSVTIRDVLLGSLAADNFVFPVGPDTLDRGTGDPFWRPSGDVPDTWMHARSALLDDYELIYAPEGGGVVEGTAGDDAIFAGAGDTTVRGGQGIDLIFSGDGSDSLDGGPKDDRLEAGNGADRLYGRGGADTFVFIPRNTGTDRIMDFAPSAGDRIDLSAFGKDQHSAGISLAQSGSATEIIWEDPFGSPSVVAWVQSATIASVEAALIWDSF